MKGDKQVIKHLNVILKNELTAVNQYFLHSRMLEDWGITKLARFEYKESIEEMQHADELIQRILFLEGLPNLQELNKLNIGQDVKEVIECDMKMEIKAIADLREAIQHCETVHDFVSRDLLIKILGDEEHHLDYMETQMDMIKQMGIENFVQINAEGAGEGQKEG